MTEKPWHKIDLLFQKPCRPRVIRTLLVGQEPYTSASVVDENTRSSPCGLNVELEDLLIPSEGTSMNIDLVVEILEQVLSGNTVE